MIDIAKTGTIFCRISILASIGGYENGMYGFGGMVSRVVIFSFLLVACIKAEDVLRKRKRARRVAARLTQKNK